ncbi:15-hydroxyprostaglandin dehydrogenase [NAD(+)]-like isoform X1 [Amphiura filiformis]|uniref:15-hydroxyprostaglandin dehydrogenase [NAD(+)]-like isoform X1 n=1 Tax=Amphiura filiformis TaxID=82378 RepID=UPI003B21832B
MDIAGKVALVTGGASGIGKAMVELMLRKQAKAVFIIDVNDDYIQQTRTELEKEFDTEKFHLCKCDVSSKEQMEECFKQVITSYGALHIVCNNAGIANEINWERMLHVNLNGVIIGTKLAVQYMEGESCGGGVIVNTSSDAALSLAPFMSVFVASKYAILGYTREIATFDPIVMKKKIRVNAVCPSSVNTNIMSHIKLENETYQQIFQPLLGSVVKHDFSPQAFAEYFVKLIEEPHHGAVMHAQKGKYEMIADDTKSFRQRTGLEDTYTKLCDTAVLSLSSHNA